MRFRELKLAKLEENVAWQAAMPAIYHSARRVDHLAAPPELPL
jgi:hypothetical protein